MESLAERPVGDLLEEILEKGAQGFSAYASLYPAAPMPCRLTILLGALCLGEAVDKELRERLSSRDSLEKRRLFLGLGHMGHPAAEGYLVRLLREKPALDVMALALRGLGRIRGTRSLASIVEALAQPFSFEPACDALVSYGSAEAVAVLISRASELAAFRALAELGAPAGRELFLVGLSREAEWQVEALRGIGKLGDPNLGEAVLPFLKESEANVRRSAFEAYARLGAPAGPSPLLEAASAHLAPWMIVALGWIAHPEVHSFLLASLDPPRARGLLGRLFGRRKRPAAEPRTIYRAIRGDLEPETRRQLAGRLRTESDWVCLREILSHSDLASDEHGAAEIAAAWRRGPLLVSYLSARALLEQPTKEFLCEALALLARPGLTQLDDAPASADPDRLREAHAHEHNPFLQVGGFLDSGLVNLDDLEASLRGRFVEGAFPSDVPPKTRYQRPEELDVGAFLSAFTDAYPAKADSLARLWDLLDQLADRGASLLNLFLAWTGDHRGAIQREIVRGIDGALRRFVQGKTDQFLPELEAVAAHVPVEGPLTRRLREALEVPRRMLMAECRDFMLMAEGSARGDMVLVERL